jgi:hypothetical protein
MRYRLRTLLILLQLAITSVAMEQNTPDSAAALEGDWQVIEMVYRTTVQDLKGGPGGWFIFGKGGVIIFLSADTDAKTLEFSKRVNGVGNPIRYAVDIRAREMDIWFKFPWSKEATLTKAIYELRDDKLRIVWRDGEGERPTDFDEVYKDKTLTLYVCKRVK